eukprot:1195387-Prorocentrum_minimum.AAC.1
MRGNAVLPSLTLPGLARRSDKPSAARRASGRRPRGGRWEEAAHRQGTFYHLSHMQCSRYPTCHPRAR